MKKYFITIMLVAISADILADTSVIGISGLFRQSNGDINKSVSSDKLNITGKSIFSTITATTYKGISASSVSFDNISAITLKVSNTSRFNNISTYGGRVKIYSTGVFDLNNDSQMIARGTFGSGNTLAPSGAGTRFIWYPRKAAFRAGYVDGTQWDDANIGNYSIALGDRNKVSSPGSGIFGGDTNQITGSLNYSTFIVGGSTNTSIDSYGYNFIGSGESNSFGSQDGHGFIGSGKLNSIAAGNKKYNFIAGGYNNAISGGQDNMVIGSYNAVSSTAGYNYILGDSNTISGGVDSVNIGVLNTINADNVIALGYGANITQANSVVMHGSSGKEKSVGIQTTTPRRRLDILDTTNPQIRLTYTDNSIYSEAQTDSSGNLNISNTGGRVGINQASPSSTLHIGGSFATAFALYSTNQTLGVGNHLVACHAKTNVTLKLPSGNTISGREYRFKKIDSTTNKCFINATTTNTVDGFQSYSGLDTRYEATSVISRGTNGWLIFGSY